MKHLLIIFSILLLTSCINREDDVDTAATAPIIAEVTAVATPTNDSTPDYTFSSTEAGTITYGGSCSSNTSSAISGNNTITLVSLSRGTYSDCTITVTDTSGNVSNTLTLSSFFVGEQIGGSIQSGSTLSLSTTVTTLAGTDSAGSANGTGTSASFETRNYKNKRATNR